MRLETPFALGLAILASALWSVTYYATPYCSGAGKVVGDFEAGCQTLYTGTESDKISTDSGNNIALSTDSNCNYPYKDAIPSEVTDRWVNAALRSFQNRVHLEIM